MKNDNAILRPYESFNTRPLEDFMREERAEEINGNQAGLKAGLIMLSGPPGSGKSSALASTLLSKMGKRAAIVRPSDMIYACMRICMLPETHLDYADFKALPLGRERLIAAATQLRNMDSDVFSVMCLTTQAWKQNDFIILDNAGFRDEVDFFPRFVEPGKSILLEVYMPYADRKDNAAYQRYIKCVTEGLQWPKDSRGSLTVYASNKLGANRVMCAQSSDFMLSVLNERVFSKEALRPGAAESTLGTLRKLYAEANRDAAVRDLFDTP